MEKRRIKVGIEELIELYSRTLKDNAEDMTRIMHVISKIGLVLVAQGLIKMEDLSLIYDIETDEKKYLENMEKLEEKYVLDKIN